MKSHSLLTQDEYFLTHSLHHLMMEQAEKTPNSQISMTIYIREEYYFLIPFLSQNKIG
jgi:hypothetical protein